MRILLLGIALLVSFSSPADNEPLRIGLTGKYPPFNYFDKTGKLVGFDIDFANAICKDIKRPCKFIPQPWDGILGALLTGKLDAIIGSMAITENRQKKASFSIPYYESGAQLLIRPERPNPKIKGYQIGVTLGTTYKQFAERKFPNATIKSYKGDIEVLQDIIVGRIDAILTDKLVGLYMAKSLNAKLIPFGEPLYKEEIGIPVEPGNKVLLSKINQSIARIRASPYYEELKLKYFGNHRSSPNSQTTRWRHVVGLIARATWNTVLISFEGILIGCLAALILAGLVIGLPKPFSRIVSFYIDFIRSTPFMVQLFAIYFGLPALSITLSPWSSGVIAIAIHSSAYLSEIIKIAYQSVPTQQHYASKTLGIGDRDSLRFIIWPQMLPVMVAPSLNTVVAMIKDSAIVSVISVHELMMQTQELISATFQPMEFYLLAAAVYFCLTYPILIAGKRLELGFKKKGLIHG